MTRLESKLIIGIPIAVLLFTLGLLIILFNDYKEMKDDQITSPGSSPFEEAAEPFPGDEASGRSAGKGYERLTPVGSLMEALVAVPDIDKLRETFHAELIRKYHSRSDFNKEWERPVIGYLEKLGILDFETEWEVWLIYHDIGYRLNKVNKSNKEIKNESQKGRKKTKWIKEILSYVYNPDQMILNRSEGYQKRKREISDNFLAFEALLGKLESAVHRYNHDDQDSHPESATADRISQGELSALLRGAVKSYEAIYECWPWYPLMEAFNALKVRVERMSIKNGSMPASSELRYFMKEFERHERDVGKLSRSLRFECDYLHPDKADAMRDASLDRYTYLADISCIEVFERLLLEGVLDGMLNDLLHDQERVDQIGRLPEETYDPFVATLKETVLDLIVRIAGEANRAEPIMSTDTAQAMVDALWPSYRSLLDMAAHTPRGDERLVRAQETFDKKYTKMVDTIVESKKRRIRFESLKAKMMSCISFLVSDMVWEDHTFFQSEDTIFDGHLRKKDVDDWEDELSFRLEGTDNDKILDRSERKAIVQGIRSALQKFQRDMTDEAEAELRTEYSNLVSKWIEDKYRSGIQSKQDWR